MQNDSLLTLQIINNALDKTSGDDHHYLKNGVELGFEWQYEINKELERRIGQALFKHLSDDDLIFLSAVDNDSGQINQLIEYYIRKQK